MKTYKKTVEKWGVFEVTCDGICEGNPFTERRITGHFTGKNESVTVDGFYDGDGIYRVRFMPSFEGCYTFQIEGNYGGGDWGGVFEVTAPSEGNHGPVRVANTYYFSYEDGTPYYSVGTTCYVWHLQSDKRIAETLETLKNNVFNKIRFCIFPKHYSYNLYEPRSYPYEGTPMDSSVLTEENFIEFTGKKEGNHFNLMRFNPAYFRHIEWCILRLQEIGIEADLIVMHPYDRWGFSDMTKEQDTLYWKYVIARFSAYRNVWWSLANEYDLLPHKTLEDWEGYAKILCEEEPYNHLRSIHQCHSFYDHSRPWITHCSIQCQDFYKAIELVNAWKVKYRKPIVLDEIAYEGNIQYGWGNISGQELLRRFWEAICTGSYPGHGETYINNKNVLWWSHGGKLYGESQKRFRLLYQIILEIPGVGLVPYEHCRWDEICAVSVNELRKPVKSYYLYYYSLLRPAFRDYYFDDETEYEVNVIDTWEMTIDKKGIFKGKFRLDLPGKSYIAVQIKKVCKAVFRE